jgi:hypothetical protein
MGGGVAATGVFFAAQPARSRQNTSPAFLMLSVFALSRPLVDGNLGYTSRSRLVSSQIAAIEFQKVAAANNRLPKGV